MDKIRLDHVTYEYSSGTPYAKVALNDVCLGFPEDSVTGIIGKTGSGKSTLVQLLNGLLKPNTGTVLLDGKNIWEAPKKIGSVRFRVGLVMQYPEYQLFEETIGKDIAFGPRNMGLSEEEIASRITEVCAFVGIDPSLLSVSPFDLSGGQKRRVAIAGVMAMRPEVLVLDEPAAGLDPRGRDSIFKGILEYQKATHATVIIVSHSMEDMARFCERIVVMADSRVAMEGSRDAVFGQAQKLLSCGLDVPLITRICIELNRSGLPVDTSVYTVPDAVSALAKILAGPPEGGGNQ